MITQPRIYKSRYCIPLSSDDEIYFDESLDALENNDPTLISLHLRIMLLTDNYISKMMIPLSRNTHLTTLDFQCNYIRHTGIKHLADALRNNSSLTTLNLDYNKVKNKGIIHIAEILSYNVLVNLSLYSNLINDKGTTVLGRALATNTSLRCLTLGHNNITASGFHNITTGLTDNSTLTELSMDWNLIKSLSPITCPSLKYLNLSGNQLYDNAITALPYHTLTELHLSYTQLTDISGEYLVQIMEHNTSLIILNIDWNEVSDKYIEDIKICCTRNLQQI